MIIQKSAFSQCNYNQLNRIFSTTTKNIKYSYAIIYFGKINFFFIKSSNYIEITLQLLTLKSISVLL